MPSEKHRIATIPDLGTLNFKVPKLPTDSEPSIVLSEEPVDAVFNGIPIKVHIKNESSLVDDLRVELNIGVSTKTQNNVASIKIIITKGKEGTSYSGFTKVENFDHHALKGLGRALWVLALQLMQKFADEWHAPVVHQVAMDPKRGLSENKWRELFIPLLDNNGYQNVDKNLWKRIYIPRGK